MSKEVRYKVVETEDKNSCIGCVIEKAKTVNCIEFNEARCKEGLKACEDGYIYIQDTNNYLGYEPTDSDNKEYVAPKGGAGYITNKLSIEEAREKFEKSHECSIGYLKNISKVRPDGVVYYADPYIRRDWLGYQQALKDFGLLEEGE